MVIVEGKTELTFVKEILAPYLGAKNVFMTPTVLSKPGQRGGQVRFLRARNDIARHLKQRSDTYVSLLVDYYGIGTDWPGLDCVRAGASPSDIANAICQATQQAVDTELAVHNSGKRFLPHITVHEFEALLFSDPATLADTIQISQRTVEAILQECGQPEAIDNSPQGAPSKRIQQINRRFKKTTSGIAIARKIGIERMRSKCPVFNSWLERLESLAGEHHLVPSTNLS